ncbi:MULTISPECIES: response regulator transcription factor [unclassified Herbaspirillum]|uniref:response regulator transcription factor n=1 Tax=unclassified Herbaspirillum TaxID=2624150 RepID=UPI00160E4969|nr:MULTISPECIES: response regulator [unclassified Herbaspirillum]
MQNIIYIVDDDDFVRASIGRLLQSVGHRIKAFSTAAEFLQHPFECVPSCLILDMNMPMQDGFHVLDTLVSMGNRLPILFLTGFGSIPLSVRAMKAGAAEFLTKPVSADELLMAVDNALLKAASSFHHNQEMAEQVQRYQLLTPRERTILELAIGGLLNKQIASELSISEITAKVHKRRVMEKMQTRTLADLVRVSERLGISSARSR